MGPYPQVRINRKKEKKEPRALGGEDTRPHCRPEQGSGHAAARGPHTLAGAGGTRPCGVTRGSRDKAPTRHPAVHGRTLQRLQGGLPASPGSWGSFGLRLWPPPSRLCPPPPPTLPSLPPSLPLSSVATPVPQVHPVFSQGHQPSRPSGPLRATSSELLKWIKALSPSKVAGGHERGGTVVNPNIQAARWGVGSMQGGCGGGPGCPHSHQALSCLPSGDCAPSRGARSLRPLPGVWAAGSAAWRTPVCSQPEPQAAGAGGLVGRPLLGGPGAPGPSSLGGSCLEQGCGGPVSPSLGPQPAALTHPTASAWPLASGSGEGTLGAPWTPGRWAPRGGDANGPKGRGCK